MCEDPEIRSIYIPLDDHVFRMNCSSWTGLCYIRKSNGHDGTPQEKNK